MFLNTMFLFSVAKVRRISNTHQIYQQKNVNFCFFIDLNQKPEAHKGSFWDKCLLFRNCCNNILTMDRYGLSRGLQERCMNVPMDHISEV